MVASVCAVTMSSVRQEQQAWVAGASAKDWRVGFHDERMCNIRSSVRWAGGGIGQAEIAENKETLATATAIREKEAAEFRAQETETWAAALPAWASCVVSLGGCVCLACTATAMWPRCQDASWYISRQTLTCVFCFIISSVIGGELVLSDYLSSLLGNTLSTSDREQDCVSTLSHCGMTASWFELVAERPASTSHTILRIIVHQPVGASCSL